jgi:hypothetical protein|tara:strand:- start:202 stop:366 length:165 start_codon:yes stop_codon:yes gene_type:complete
MNPKVTAIGRPEAFETLFFVVLSQTFSIKEEFFAIPVVLLVLLSLVRSCEAHGG